MGVYLLLYYLISVVQNN